MTKEQDDNYKYRNVVKACLDTPWAILPVKLDVITELLEAKASGAKISEDDVRLAMSVRAGSEDDAPKTIRGVHVMQLMDTLGPRMNLMIRYSGGTSTQQFAAAFNRAMSDDEVKSILIEIDSPGGAVTGTQELADLIYQARGSKPIHAIVRGMCASAAYWIGSACDKVYSEPSSTVGSIGAYAIHSENSKLAEKVGYKFTVIKFGRYKAAGNQYEPLSEDYLASWQERIDAAGNAFVAAVARNRGVSIETAGGEKFGQGKVYFADEAFSRGMIDGVKTMDKAFEELAGESASGGSQRTGTFAKGNEQMKFTAKTKAALFAQGLIQSMEASDEVCEAACRGRGIDLREASSVVGLDESVLIAAINGVSKAAVVTPAKATSTDVGHADHNHSAATANDITVDEDAIKKQAVIVERNRCKSIQVSGKQFGVSAEVIQTAIDEDVSIETAIERFEAELADENKPVGIVPTGSHADATVDAAVNTLMERCGLPVEDADASCNGMQNHSRMEICQAVLGASGVNTSRVSDESEAFSLVMSLGGEHLLASGDSPAQRSGDLPNVMDNLQNRVLDHAYSEQTPSYRSWAKRRPDAQDLRPHKIVRLGGPENMDIIEDGKKAKQITLSEETAWIAPDRYSESWAMTTEMWLGDELDIWAEGLMLLQAAWGRTPNALCLNLLTGNVVLPQDSKTLFHADHNNLRSNGGIPDIDELGEMNVLHKGQTGVGGVGILADNISSALVPTRHGLRAGQLLNVESQTYPNVVSERNVWQKKNIEPVEEPYLDRVSLTQWYTFITKRKSPVHVQFVRGYAEKGRRWTWFDPATGSRYVRVEGIVAAGLLDHRGVCRNSGTP